MFGWLAKAFRREPVRRCGKCPLYRRSRGDCAVAVIQHGEVMHLPVRPRTKCLFQQHDIPVNAVRWWNDEKGNHIAMPPAFEAKVRGAEGEDDD